MKKVMFRHVVVGYKGEVGKAVYGFLKDSKNTVNVTGIDVKGVGLLEKPETIRKFGVPSELLLHICIPYNKKFIKTVKKYIKDFEPYATIIYSTVVPGTCRKLGVNVIHSPIEGRHPHLLESFKTFTRFLSYNTNISSVILGNIAHFFKSNKLEVIVNSSPEVTEVGKLLSTTRYGVMLMFCDEMGRICKKYNVSYHEAVVMYQYAYNELYKKLGTPRFIQPILFPPKGYCGGHCVVPNSQLLAKCGGEVLTKMLSKFNYVPFHLRLWNWLNKVVRWVGVK